MTTVLLSRDNKDITKFGLICASPRQHVHAIKQIRKARTIIWRHNKLVDHLGSRSDIQQSSTSHRDVSFCGGLLIAKGSFSRTFYRVAECTKEKKRNMGYVPFISENIRACLELYHKKPRCNLHIRIRKGSLLNTISLSHRIPKTWPHALSCCCCCGCVEQ